MAGAAWGLLSRPWRGRLGRLGFAEGSTQPTRLIGANTVRCALGGAHCALVVFSNCDLFVQIVPHLSRGYETGVAWYKYAVAA